MSDESLPERLRKMFPELKDAGPLTREQRRTIHVAATEIERQGDLLRKSRELDELLN